MIAEDRNQKTKLLREFKDSDYITYEDENPDKVVTKSNESSNILQMTKKLDKAIEFITDLVAVNDQLKKSKKKKLQEGKKAAAEDNKQTKKTEAKSSPPAHPADAVKPTEN